MKSNLNDRVMRLPEVINATGLSRSSIYSFMKAGEFPKQIKIGANAVGWRESDIRAWLDKFFKDLPAFV